VGDLSDGGLHFSAGQDQLGVDAAVSDAQ